MRVKVFWNVYGHDDSKEPMIVEVVYSPLIYGTIPEKDKDLYDDEEVRFLNSAFRRLKGTIPNCSLEKACKDELEKMKGEAK